MPKDDFCHFLLLAIHKPCSSVKITRAQARRQKSSEAEREHKQKLDGAQPTDISVIDPLPDNSPPAFDHDTHTDSPQLSDDDVFVEVDFLWLLILLRILTLITLKMHVLAHLTVYLLRSCVMCH